MRTAAYEVDAALRPPQARVSQAKLFVLGNFVPYQRKSLRHTGIRACRRLLRSEKIHRY